MVQLRSQRGSKTPEINFSPATPNADLGIQPHMAPETSPQVARDADEVAQSLDTPVDMTNPLQAHAYQVPASLQVVNNIDPALSSNLYYAVQYHTPYNYQAVAPSARTIPGSPAKFTQEEVFRQGPRIVILHDVRAHNYTMPAGPILNFTMVEINVLLPRWFENEQISYRFQNNYLSAKAHVIMMAQHRSDFEGTQDDQQKMTSQISNRYRKTMRRIDAQWTKATHTAPQGWNTNDMAVNNFRPDAARDCGFITPRPLPFGDLIHNVKKIPSGADAGDLSRALQYALANQKTNTLGLPSPYIFPDDLHVILGIIGYTQITKEHTDRAIVRRYDGKPKANNYKRDLAPTVLARPKLSMYSTPLSSSAMQQHAGPQSPYGVLRPQPALQPMPNYMHNGFVTSFPHNGSQYATGSGQNVSHNGPAMQNMGSANLFPSSPHSFSIGNQQGDIDPNLANSIVILNADNNVNEDLRDPLHSPPQPPNPPTDMYPHRPPLEDTTSREWYLRHGFDLKDIPTMQEMDALLDVNHNIDYSALLATPPPSSPPPPGVRFLAECAEADDMGDMSDLAKAARWCRYEENAGRHFDERHLALVLGLM